jgi:hypothetical protein
MNPFLSSYESRLQSWASFRQKIDLLSLEEQCIEVDRYWQKVPFVEHYLHPDLINEWPNPWDLLHINTYCPYARGLGMIYTLLFLGVCSIDLAIAKDDNGEQVVLVLVDGAKYILNYWPESVLNIKLSDFTIVKKIDTTPLQRKIGSL